MGKSKLSIIRNSLETNPDVVIGDTWDSKDLYSESYTSHRVCFSVAPKKGLYIPERLNHFMYNLIPEIKYDYRTEFVKRCGDLDCGKLEFHEKFGKQKIIRLCEITDEELLNSNGFVDGKRKVETELDFSRSISVYIFPNKEFAEFRCRYTSLPLEMLERKTPYVKEKIRS